MYNKNKNNYYRFLAKLRKSKFSIITQAKSHISIFGTNSTVYIFLDKKNNTIVVSIKHIRDDIYVIRRTKNHKLSGLTVFDSLKSEAFLLKGMKVRKCLYIRQSGCFLFPNDYENRFNNFTIDDTISYILLRRN